MPFVQTNNVTLEYEILGPDNGTPLLLIMGLGMQMIGWPEGFCGKLVEAGFRVIRFDNRDVGLSTKLDHLGSPNIPLEFIKFMMRMPLKSPYLIDDMAQDAAGLLDQLGIAQAHIVGASLGGMIAQNLAANFPEKILSLTSIMSTTGRRSLPGPTSKARRALLTPPAKRGDAAGAITRMKNIFRIIGSPGFLDTEDELEDLCGRHVRRSYHPPGSARQLMAIAASGDRTNTVRRIAAPTLVIHGKDDPLVPVAAGIDTAREIRHAKLCVIEGMGHDLPTGLHQRLVDEIAGHCRPHVEPVQ
jgi:pimeloyl-ACP methyl ester carboxylesterase